MDKNRGAPLAGPGEVVLVTYADPLAKAAVLDGAARRAESALYLDFDLMRAGHLASGALRPAAGVSEVQAGGAGAREAMAAAISRASRGGCLVIVDSLNGLHRAGPEAAVNASMMMLASAARQGGSGLAVACMARAEPGGGLVMVPMGRRAVALAGARQARAVALPGGRASVERAPQTAL